MNVFEKDQMYIAPTYKRFPLEIVRGAGSEVFDSQGKRYIDLGSGIAVTSFGVSDPLWQEAVIAQLGKVQHMSNLYYTEPCTELAEKLCLRTGMKKVFFSNSGAEANECAIKAARKWASDHYGPEKNIIVTMENSFHGRTLTTLAATGQDHYHELFQPLTPGFVSVPAGDPDALEKVIETGRVAGVLLECIQGEGGVLPLPADYIQTVAEWAKSRNYLFMVDEVQTGNGRTGELYSYMHFGVKPDVVSTAKGLAGGLPLGATLLGERVQDVFHFGDHGSTFGGNPVCCAAALSVLNRIDEALLSEVRSKGEYLRCQFENAPGVEAVSGLGLMLGLKTVRPASEVVTACMQNGVLCLTAKEKVRLLPALNIPFSLLAEAAEIILEACK